MRLALAAMATRFEFALEGEDPAELRAAGEAALDEVREVETLLSRFRRDSFLSFLQREARRRAVELPGDLFELFLLCRRLREETRGAFDVTVGSFMERRGFHVVDSESAPRSAGFDAVELDVMARTLRLHGDVRFDFGAVGKGVALDRAGEVLREAGVTTALLHGGTSTVLTIGPPAGLRGYPVTLRDPRDADRSFARVRLRDRALSVSAPGGRRHHGAGHVLDPRTGHSVDAVACAGVVASTATLADAWSTACVVLEDAPEDLATLILWSDGARMPLLRGSEGVFRCNGGVRASRTLTSHGEGSDDVL